MDVISKKQMSEEDIKLHYITPAITAQWNIQHITMETKVTDGRINLKGNLVIREKPKRADYVLYVSANNPIAIVEAKDNNHAVSYGLQQAMTYAQMLDVPFAYSSNGDGFMEHDFLTGKEREFGLDEFPTEQELIQRYKAGANGGAGLTPEQEKIIAQPYYSSQSTNRHATISALPSTAQWMPSQEGKTAFCWLWPPVQAKPTRPSKSYTAY